VEAIFEEFDEYLALQCGRSEHTRRAYLGDLRSLFEFADQQISETGLDALSLPLLRSCPPLCTPLPWQTATGRLR